MLSIPKREKGYIVLNYADTDKLCLSGLVVGEKEIKGKAAIIDIPVDKGHIIMYTFNPMRRFLYKGNLMLVFNALMNYNYLGCAKSASEEKTPKSEEN